MPVVNRLGAAALFGSRLLLAAATGLHTGLTAAARSWAAHTPVPERAGAVRRPAAALLIDLDNLRVRRGQLEDTLTALLTLAGPVDHTLAAGNSATVTADVRAICHRLGVEVLDVDGAPDAADRALLIAALQLHAGGVGHFFVASRDRAFTLLPAPFTLLLSGGGPPSRVLLQAAAEVRHLP